MANRRDFLTGLAAVALPPLPPHFKRRRKPERAESPKVKALRLSLTAPKVSVQVQSLSQASVPDANGFTVSISHTPGHVSLSWLGGTPPFELWQTSDLGKPWVKAVGPTMERTATVPVTADHMFFKVQGSLVMGLTASRSNGVININWQTPYV